MKFIILALAFVSAASAGYIAPGGFGAPVVEGYNTAFAGGYHGAIGTIGAYSAPVVSGYHAPVAAAPIGYGGVAGAYSAPGFGYGVWKKKASAWTFDISE